MRFKGMVVAAIFAALISPITPAQAAQVTSGLLIDLNAANPSSYSGSGTTWIDLAGGDDNATLVNGPTHSSSSGSGFQVDGGTQYIEIANRAALQPTTSNAFTIMLWTKVDSYADYDGLFGKQFGSPSYDGYSLVMSANNSLRLQMNGQSVNGGYSSGNFVFTTGAWQLFTAVVKFGGNTSNPSKVYVNATEVISAASTESGIPSPTASLRISESLQSYNARAPMKVGAFAVYNRALSSQEISDSYDFYLNYVPDNTAPTITCGTTFSVAENQSTITTLAANETSTWTLRASSDSATVNLNPSTGNLAFKTSPNFEVPTDANTDNDYQITVRATDAAGNYAELTISITVTNIDENSYATISFSSPPQKGINTVVTTSLNVAGTVSITVGGKRIPGCSTKVSSGSPPQITCNWKPAVAGVLTLSARVTPTDQNYLSSVKYLSVSVAPRVGRR